MGGTVTKQNLAPRNLEVWKLELARFVDTLSSLDFEGCMHRY
jgi:hypothetical protein